MLSVWSGHCVLGKQALCNVNVSPNAHSPHLALAIANDGLWLAIMHILNSGKKQISIQDSIKKLYLSSFSKTEENCRIIGF